MTGGRVKGGAENPESRSRKGEDSREAESAFPAEKGHPGGRSLGVTGAQVRQVFLFSPCLVPRPLVCAGRLCVWLLPRVSCPPHRVCCRVDDLAGSLLCSQSLRPAQHSCSLTHWAKETDALLLVPPWRSRPLVCTPPTPGTAQKQHRRQYLVCYKSC